MSYGFACLIIFVSKLPRRSTNQIHDTAYPFKNPIIVIIFDLYESVNKIRMSVNFFQESVNIFQENVKSFRKKCTGESGDIGDIATLANIAMQKFAWDFWDNWDNWAKVDFS